MVDKSSPINTNDRTITDNMYNFTLFPRDYPGDASYTSTMKSQRLYRIFKEINGATVSPFYKSSNDFTYVIPYVVSLKFTCYNSLFKDMRNINGDTVPGTVLNGDAVYDYPITAAATIAAQPTPFPYAIKIDIVLLDRTSWKKWLAMGGNVATPTGSTGDTGTIKTFREAQQRTFSKLIYLGERDTK